MSNALWYALITFLSIFIFIYTLWKVKNRKVIALYTFLSGLTYFFEYIVFTIFQSYIYKPNILKDDYLDSILGAISSNAFSVPMTCTLVGTLRLNWRWMLSITGIILLIEKLFIYLNIYKHFWWNLSYTGIGFIICMVIAKYWFTKLNNNLTIWVRFLTVYFTSLLIHSSLVFLLASLLQLYHYEIGWFQGVVRDHVAFATAYALFMSLIFTSLITFNVKWKWRIVVLLLTVPINLFLLRIGVLHLSDKWSLVHFLVIRFFILIMLDLFNRLMLRTNSKCY